MRKTLIIAMVIVAIVAGFSIAMAQGYGKAGKAGPPDGAPCLAGPGGPGGAPGAGFGPGLLRGIDLTEEQTQLLEQLREQFQADTEATRQEMQAKQQQMRELWAADEPDTAAIKALIAEMEPLKTELAYAGVDHHVQVLSILTEEQRQTLQERMEAGPPAGPRGGAKMGLGTCPTNGAGMQRGCCPRG